MTSPFGDSVVKDHNTLGNDDLKTLNFILVGYESDAVFFPSHLYSLCSSQKPGVIEYKKYIILLFSSKINSSFLNRSPDVARL